MSTGINIFQINEEEVMELSFWGWGMRQLCRVHVFRQQIVGFYIFVSVQYVYIHKNFPVESRSQTMDRYHTVPKII